MATPSSVATTFSTSPPSAGGRTKKGLFLSWNVLLSAIFFPIMEELPNLPQLINVVCQSFKGLVWMKSYSFKESLPNSQVRACQVDFSEKNSSQWQSGWRWWTGRPRGTSPWARMLCSSLTASGWRTTCAAWLITLVPLLKHAGIVGWCWSGFSVLVKS